MNIPKIQKNGGKLKKSRLLQSNGHLARRLHEQSSSLNHDFQFVSPVLKLRTFYSLLGNSVFGLTSNECLSQPHII